MTALAQPTRSAGRRELIIALLSVLMSAASSGPNYVLPDYLLAIQAHYGLQVSQLGFIPGGESLAIGIGCLLTGFFLRRGHGRAILIAAAVCVIGDMASLVARDFVSIAAVRMITGLAGEGPLYAISYMVIAASLNPDRVLGIAVTAIALAGAAVLMVEGPLTHALGPAAVLLPFAVVSAMMLVWVLRDKSIVMVKQSIDTPSEKLEIRGGLDKGALAIIVSIVLLMAVVSALWAFIGTAAEAAGARPEDIARAISVGIVFGLAGSIVPAVIGNRFGRILPVTLCGLGLILGCVLMVSGGSFMRVAVASAVVQFSWGMNAVYMLTGLVARDNGGRYTSVGAVAQMLGMALGPPIFGSFISGFGYVNLPFLAAAGALPGLALFVLGSASWTRVAGWRLFRQFARTNNSPT